VTQESGLGQPWRVLVVDDEENLNWSLVTSLRREHYAADGAVSAEIALRRMAEQSYECVISDVKMPGMDGFELLQWLRSHRPQTRVIMMTAFGSPTARQEALQGGVVAYLEKPFDLRVLKEELRKLAGSAVTSGQTAVEGYDTLDVAQVLNLTRRDIAVHVETRQYSGTLRFLRGELVAAEAGDLHGEPAFFALCVPRAIRVEPEAWNGSGARNITQPLSYLIFQALAMRERRSPVPLPPSSGTPAAAIDGAEIDETPTAHLPVVPVRTPPVAESGSAIERSPAEGTSVSEPARDQPQAQAGQALADLVHRIVSGCPVPCSVALLRSDGTLLAQSFAGFAEIPTGAYAHLAQAAQAARRALLVADWGTFEEYRAVASAALVMVRRLARGEQVALCAVALPRDADPEVAGQMLERYEPDLLAALG
jgi:DNA-binding response OmpR family regulator